MSQPARKKATYEDLNAIPENMTGEIINGELVVTPRPSRKQVVRVEPFQETEIDLGSLWGPQKL